MPEASVITPLYNGADRIADCIESVARQSLADLEHIVIDNNSTDDGPERVRDLQKTHPRLQLLSESEIGPGPARNAGIRAATSRYIAFLDADDRWKPQKLEIQIDAMRRTGAVLSWTSYDVMKNGTFSRIQAARQSVSHDDILTKRATIGCLTAVYDSHVLGKLYMNSLPMRQDMCLWLDILKMAETQKLACIGVPVSLAVYNVHSNSLTADKKKAARMQWAAYRQHVGLSRLQASRIFAGYAVRAIRDRIFSSTEPDSVETAGQGAASPRNTP